MRSRRLLILMLLVATTAPSCSTHRSAWTQRPPVFGSSDSAFNDRQVIDAVFSTYSGPVGFYAEAPVPFAAPLYVTNVGVAGQGPRPDSCMELATSDTVQARAWAEASVGWWCTVAHNPPLATDRYFEFATYIPNDGPRMPVRVHRASYIDRSRYDLFDPGPDLGTLEVRPVDALACRGVAEYLWFKDHGRNSALKVLTSFTASATTGQRHTIFWTEFIPRVLDLTPDRIVLRRSEFWIDGASGIVDFHESVIREVRYR